MKTVSLVVVVLGLAALGKPTAFGANDGPERRLPAGYTHKQPLNADAPLVLPKIDSRPSVSRWPVQVAHEVPKFDRSANNPEDWQRADLRHADLSALDLRDRLEDLLFATFDYATKWPAPERLPLEFRPEEIMEIGKNPGLGVRRLHKEGVTGRGVSVAVIDQPLVTEHIEYKDRLRLYEQIGPLGKVAPMHGTAVASIAVGKTLGVAPEADLFYIAVCNLNFRGGRDFTHYAKAVHRVLNINEQLRPEEKVRVISMSIGWDPGEDGYEDIVKAAEDAKNAGLLVLSSSIARVHGLKFHGLGREPVADPDEFESYGPGLWWEKLFVRSPRQIVRQRLLVPMDSRTVASFASPTGYTFDREGGWSWCTPYIAGLYALALQVDPSMRPDRFWDVAMRTGRTVQVPVRGSPVAFGPIVDPYRLIEELR